MMLYLYTEKQHLHTHFFFTSVISNLFSAAFKDVFSSTVDVSTHPLNPFCVFQQGMAHC